MENNPLDVTRAMGADTATLDRTLVAGAAAPDATQMGATLACPVCATMNAALETYCSECGFLLASQPGGADEPSETQGCGFELVEERTDRRFPLHEGVNQVGRENCDVLLMEPTVSRRHAQITVTGSALEVQDHGSTNGTQVDGTPLAPGTSRPIVAATMLRFGSASFVLAGTSAEPSDTSDLTDPSDPTDPTDPTNLSDQPIAIARLRSASDERADIAVGPGLASIGRRTGNTYSIPDDPFVSGRHAEISADDEGVRICDVGSTNGTTVNGQRIQPNEPVTLMDGDEVGIGQGRYVFEALAPAPDPDRDADDEWFDVELFDDMAVTDSDTDGSNRSEETP